ncbi:hypothetical protein Ctha_1721 [Chloroherpeton thalassium ATCC 35110]|uniref:Uncharacterized protein n=1 Tax=Chloroherpeton thalassium (strain ATCC 35110 / GB-78) TaxID=517418 RepID=B3QT79_CHLT3|nr:hypothetical protein Ctha_1721 [Chloroherpeton thalassium ATCC 35110]
MTCFVSCHAEQSEVSIRLVDSSPGRLRMACFVSCHAELSRSTQQGTGYIAKIIYNLVRVLTHNNSDKRNALKQFADLIG